MGNGVGTAANRENPFQESICMNRNNPQSRALRARDTLRGFGRKLVAGGSLALVMTHSAMAATGIGDTAATQITGAKSQVETVQTAMLGVLIVLVVFGLIRKSFGK